MTENNLPILATAENETAIRAALKTVESGRGQNHLRFEGVLKGAKRAETAMDDLGIPQADRPGAVYFFADGGADSHSYRSAIPTTQAAFVRGEHGWELAGLSSIAQYPKARIIRDMVLTPAQASKLSDPKLAGKRVFLCRAGAAPKAVSGEGKTLAYLGKIPGTVAFSTAPAEAERIAA